MWTMYLPQLRIGLDDPVSMYVENVDALFEQHTSDQESPVTVLRTSLATHHCQSLRLCRNAELLQPTQESKVLRERSVEDTARLVVEIELGRPTAERVPHEPVLDPRLLQMPVKDLAVEVRGIPRKGGRSHIDDDLNPLRKQSMQELFNRQIGVPDRPDLRHYDRAVHGA